ncbi:hypothetical protein [Kordiimonas gwangyangensis]|uniref:hypothetical protein n=2 Tax=Kordiimonas gwangyangensis TaxID=288022 RepID=UPI0003726AA1|nr:hypothetical protein [Kordiimonas gwangyangensis]
MPRSLRYIVGILAMAAALIIVIFMPAPMAWAARAALLGPFLAMLWQRRRYNMLLTKQVFASALLAGFAGVAYLAFVNWSAGGAWPTSFTITASLPVVMALLVTFSFHHLTMGTGRMA